MNPDSVPLSTCILISGSSDLLSAAHLLEEIGRRCGQENIEARLRFLLTVPYFGNKIPHAVLIYNQHKVLSAAVIVLEYRWRQLGLGIFVPIDPEGDLTVLSAPDLQSEAASRAAAFLMQKQARAVYLVAHSDSTGTRGADTPPNTILHRDLRRTLPLLGSLDETLAMMGPRSRRNLRNFARRAIKEFGAIFYPECDISENGLIEINRVCAYPVPDWVSSWRYHSTHTIPGGFIAGLRAENGEWLSLLGGRRYGDTTIIDWQMNRIDLGSISIGTAMRYFQTEHEIAIGRKWLQFNGSTAHSIQNAFQQETVTDLLWMRPPYSRNFIRRLWAKLLPNSNRLKALLTGNETSLNTIPHSLPTQTKATSFEENEQSTSTVTRSSAIVAS
ncbi:hypothetical protein [Terriglobus roseus]|uniref:Uncharacterized protein n=1 Tax=Terriglobus roseus TaxID=392734 RepID=A0A1G7JCY3_9BACT|nr:hypothetical protein [Terriglobus roseus]SDF22758.1 hypothetical protein SAMN05444167_1775 [Terriglobus roseus]